MPNSELTLESVRDEIKLGLGGDRVEVELSENTLNKVIKDTIRKYNHHLPMYGVSALTVTASQKKYLISKTGLLGVSHVAFIRSDIAGNDALFGGVFRNTSNALLLFDNDTFGDMANQLGYLEQAAEIVGSNPEWDGFWEGTNYYLYVDVRTDLYLCSYTYTWKLTPDDNATTGLPMLPANDVDWFMEYATAKAKAILGRTNRKHGGIPNPEGGQDQTDGSELVQEAREDMTNLEDAIKKRRRPLMPSV